MKFCTNCGQEYKESDIFCTKCGQKRAIDEVENSAINQENDVKNDISKDTAIESVNFDIIQNNKENKKNSKKKKGKKGLVIALIFILVLLLTGAVLYFTGVINFGNDTKNNTENVGNESGDNIDTNEPQENEDGEIAGENTGSTIDVNVGEVVADYQIHSIDVFENSVSSKISANGAAWLNVELVAGDLSKTISTKKEAVAAGTKSEFVTVTFDELFDDSYALRIRMLDDAGNDLCQPYIDVTHTDAYRDTLDKRTEDFPEDRLIVMDGGNEGGFFVVEEDAVFLVNGKNAEVSSYDDENEILVLSSTSETISEGKKIVVVKDDSLVATITAKTVQNDNGKITVTGARNDSLTDYFEFIRFEMAISSEIVSDDLVASAAFSELGTSASGIVKQVAFGGEESNPFGVIEDGVSIPYQSDTTWEIVDDVKLTGSISGELSGSFSIIWNRKFLPENSYFHCGYDVSTSPIIDLGIGFGHEFDGSEDYDDNTVITSGLATQTPYKNGVHISFVKFGINSDEAKYDWIRKLGDYFNLYADFSLDITGSIAGHVDVKVTTDIDIESGTDIVLGDWWIIKYPVKETHLDISATNPEITLSAKAEAEVFAGLKFDTGIKVKKIVDWNLVARAGAQILAEVETETNPLLSDHACYLCCKASAAPVVDVEMTGGVELSFDFLGNDDSVESKANVWKQEVPFDDIMISGYASIVHDAAAKGAFERFPAYFGVGKHECPNKLTRVYFKAVDENGESVSVDVSAIRDDGLWSAEKGNTKKVVTDSADDSSYLYPGTYTATATYEDRQATKTFTVPDDTVVVLEFSNLDYYKFIRDEILPVTPYADLSTRKGSTTPRDYWDNGDWYENSGVLSANVVDMNKDGVDDLVLFTIDENKVYAQFYTIKNGNIVAVGDRCYICSVNGVGEYTKRIGICEMDDQCYIYKQDIDFSFVAAGGQQNSVRDDFYSLGDNGFAGSMRIRDSSYDYQIERAYPAALYIKKGASEETIELPEDNYTKAGLDYLGFKNAVPANYPCEGKTYNHMDHTSHDTYTLWDTEYLTKSFELKGEVISYVLTGGSKVEVKVSLLECTELKEKIDALVD